MRHPLFARLYPRIARTLDGIGLAAHRERLLNGLRGEVVEIGVGPGGGLAHYPTAVTHVLAVEPEPRLRALATAAAAGAPVSVEVVDGVAERLPSADRSRDGAVFSMVLCSVADPGAALREAHRVLRSGGRLRALEHVRADTPLAARFQQVLDATVWPVLAGGCHTGRDTVAEIAAAGFTVERVDRFTFPPHRRGPSSLFVLVDARAD